MLVKNIVFKYTLIILRKHENLLLNIYIYIYIYIFIKLEKCMNENEYERELEVIYEKNVRINLIS